MRLFSISAFILHLNSVRAVNKQCQEELLRNNKKLSFQENKSTMAPPTAEPLIRRDGLKINYDPYAPEVAGQFTSINVITRTGVTKGVLLCGYST